MAPDPEPGFDGGMALTIDPVDPHDDAALRDHWAVTEAAQREGRPYALLESYEARVSSLRNPGGSYRRLLLLARDSGAPVGAAFLGLHLEDNAHLADLEIDVHPASRRRGVGRALHDRALEIVREAAGTTVLGEVSVPTGAEGDWAAVAFASHLGYAVVNQEDHLVLDLPAVVDEVPLPAGWEVVTWQDRCPDDLLDAYCALRTQMEHDVPLGEVDYQPTVRTPQAQRESEERRARSYTSLVAAVRRLEDGALGGYSEVLLPHGSDVVWQDDTLVMPHHRGHRFGHVLKAANLDEVLGSHPERRRIHTWTAVDNAPMQRTNAAFGFRPVERMLEVQRRLA